MGFKLLLADDSITIQKVVSIIFANEDYELTVVDNGNAALDKAREIVPDILLVDALMPGKTGYEVCREARQDPVLKNIPLLLLVGAFEPFDEEKARNSGADDHISKPFESQHLIEKVKSLIELGIERAAVHEHFALPTTDAMVANSIIIPEEAETPSIVGAGPFGTSAETVGSAGINPSEPMLLSSEDIVEATPEDDLWGVFELEEVTEGEDIRFGEIIEEDEIQPEIIDTAEEIEPFVFEEEEEEPSTIMDDVRMGFAGEPARGESYVIHEEPEHEEADTFSSTEFDEFDSSDSFLLSDEDSTGISPQDFHSGEELAEHHPEITDDFGSGMSFQQTADDKLFDLGEEYQQSSGQLYSNNDTILPRTSETIEPGAVSLSEEQLATVIARISKEIIEKIAWEVVPDLAEAIIKEEIRKIKQGK